MCICIFKRIYIYLHIISLVTWLCMTVFALFCCLRFLRLCGFSVHLTCLYAHDNAFARLNSVSLRVGFSPAWLGSVISRLFFKHWA